MSTSAHPLIEALCAVLTGQPGPHLSNEQLLALNEGSLPADQHVNCQQHLDHCTECSELFLRLVEANTSLPFPVIVPKVSIALGGNADSRADQATAAYASYLRLVTAEPDAAATGPSSAPLRFKVPDSLGEYRSVNRQTFAKVAGERLTMQDFSEPAGYPLKTRHGEVRLYWNLREHNGTTDVAFALKLPDAASPFSIRWERHFAGTGKSPEVRILTFTSDAPRVEFFGMKRPEDSEKWSFECVDTGGAL